MQGVSLWSGPFIVRRESTSAIANFPLKNIVFNARRFLTEKKRIAASASSCIVPQSVLWRDNSFQVIHRLSSFEIHEAFLAYVKGIFSLAFFLADTKTSEQFVAVQVQQFTLNLLRYYYFCF